MFIGDLFYKNKKGNIKELSREFLLEKIKSIYSNENLKNEEIDNLLSVLSFYVHNRKDDDLIEENEIDKMLFKLKKSQKESEIYIEDQLFDKKFFYNYINKKGLGIPQKISSRIFSDLKKSLNLLRSKITLSNININTFDNLLREICSKYEIHLKKDQKLSFPLDEILLIYSKFSPYETGEYFKEVVNYYLFNNFLMNRKLRYFEKKNYIKLFDLNPFQVDVIDLVLNKNEIKNHEKCFSKQYIFYNKEMYDNFKSKGKKLLFQNNQNKEKIPSIIYLDNYIPHENNIYAFTFQKNENFSLFSLDETKLPVYPALFKFKLNFDKFNQLESIEKLNKIESIIKSVKEFYYKYNEYFYLIDILKRRNLYVKIYIDITHPHYNHLLTTYLKKMIEDDFIKIVLYNNKNNINKKNIKKYLKENYLMELVINRDMWDKNLFNFFKKNNLYLLKIKKEK